MSVTLTIAGQTFNYPTTGDDGWGEEASDWAVAVSTELLQRTGGSFPLTNDVNFGASFGTIQTYIKSRTANIALTGFARMANTDLVAWRNAANNGNVLLGVNSADEVTVNGVPILVTPGGILGVADGGTSFGSYTTGDMLYASGATAFSKLGIGAANRVMLSTGTAPSWSATVPKVAGGTGQDNTNVTFPISGVIVTEAATETLTNKTLTTPVLTTPTVNGIKNAVASTKTGTYTAQTTDYLIPCNATGGAFTVNLPAASGNTGLTLVIRKIDSSFNQITIDPNSSELIDGLGDAKISTQWESLTILCDGTGWQIADRMVPCSPVNYTPTFAGLGTVVSPNFFWKRVGDSVRVTGVVRTGTVTGSTATISIPSGLTITSQLVAFYPVGTWLSSATGAAGLFMIGEPSVGTVKFSAQSATSASETAFTGGDIGSSNDIAIDFTVPIAGWAT